MSSLSQQNARTVQPSIRRESNRSRRICQPRLADRLGVAVNAVTLAGTVALLGWRTLLIRARPYPDASLT